MGLVTDAEVFLFRIAGLKPPGSDRPALLQEPPRGYGPPQGNAGPPPYGKFNLIVA